MANDSTRNEDQYTSPEDDRSRDMNDPARGGTGEGVRGVADDEEDDFEDEDELEEEEDEGDGSF